MRGKSFAVLMAMFFILGCSRSNIKVPEVDVAPIEAQKGDSHISIGNLRGYGTMEIVSQNKETVTLRVAFVTRENDAAEVNIFYGGETLKKTNLKSAGVFHGEEYYFGDIEVTEDQISYFFEVKDGKVRYFSGRNGGYYPEDIEKYSYKIQKTKLSKSIQWSQGILWYGIYVDSFYNGDQDNDPIFNEFGPEYFLPPRGVLSDGTFKSDLIDRRSWNSVESLGEFNLSEWNGDFSSYEAYEKNMNMRNYKADVRSTRRYGGDLEGVADKLDYLSNLGVGGINLSQVFYSYSSNKEDVIDYRHVSPDFGKVKTDGISEYKILDVNFEKNVNNLGEGLSEETWKMSESDKVLKELIDKAHIKGIKVMLDVNLDYVSKRFWAVKMLALQGEESPYKDWFFISKDESDDRVEYLGQGTYQVEKDETGKEYREKWINLPKNSSPELIEEIYRWNLKNLGLATLDKNGDRVRVNYENKDYRDYIAKSLKKWVSLGVDGYRIQGENLPEDLLGDIKENMREINPEFIFVKNWTKQDSFGDENYDAFENYSFGSLLIDYISKGSKTDEKDIEGAVSVSNNMNNNSKTLSNFIYLDSKETDRVFSMLSNPGRIYDTQNNTEEGYLNMRPDLLDGDSVERLKDLAMLQMTIIGAPYIYYGSEKGMWGGDAPYNRKPMIWVTDPEMKEKDIYENYEKKNKLNISGVEYNKVRGYIEYPFLDNQNIYDTYVKLINFRNQKEKLFSYGEISFLEVIDEMTGKKANDVLAYERVFGEERVVVVINRSKVRKKVAILTDERGLMKSFWKEDTKRVAGKSLKIWLDPLEGEIYYK
jgi:glycosidase